MRVAGVIFNGGKASRLGGIDKGAIEIDGVSSFGRVAGAKGAADELFVSVASDFPKKAYRGCPVIYDNRKLLINDAGEPGVILSILSGLDFAVSSGFDGIITAPADTPFLPEDFSERLVGNAPAVAISGSRVHGLHSFLPARSLEMLHSEIVGNGLRRVSKLHEVLGSAKIEFTPARMKNLNTAEDLKSLS